MRTLVHLSDLHFGRIDPALVDPLSQAVSDQRADLVAISGDVTQRARRSQFADAKAFIDSLNAHTLVVPGIHDVPLFDDTERFAAPLHRYREHISTNLEPEYVDQEMIVIGLNTARSLAFGEGRINQQQVERVMARLSVAPASLLRVIVTHHPFDVPPGAQEKHLPARSHVALARLAGASADLFLSGHLHITHLASAATRYRIDGHAALIVQAGTLSTRSRSEQPSFNVLRIQRPEMLLERYSWSEASRTFVKSAAGRFRHNHKGWIESPRATHDP
jgi:3',5'-cyclic AMP phosphodiesterase CpdA